MNNRHIYAHTELWAYIYMCIYIYTYICICIYAYTHMDSYICTCIHMFLCICLYIYISIYLYIYIIIYLYTYIIIYICMYLHACALHLYHHKFVLTCVYSTICVQILYYIMRYMCIYIYTHMDLEGSVRDDAEKQRRTTPRRAAALLERGYKRTTHEGSCKQSLRVQHQTVTVQDSPSSGTSNRVSDLCARFQPQKNMLRISYGGRADSSSVYCSPEIYGMGNVMNPHCISWHTLRSELAWYFAQDVLTPPRPI